MSNTISSELKKGFDSLKNYAHVTKSGIPNNFPIKLNTHIGADCSTYSNS